MVLNVLINENQNYAAPAVKGLKIENTEKICVCGKTKHVGWKNYGILFCVLTKLY